MKIQRVPEYIAVAIAVFETLHVLVEVAVQMRALVGKLAVQRFVVELR